MPKSRARSKQYSVRVNGVLVRKSFTQASVARQWQRDQKKIQDEIRAGIKRQFAPVLLEVHLPEWLKGREHLGAASQEQAAAGKYVLPHPHFKGKFLHELDVPDWLYLLGPSGALVQEHKLAPATHNRIRSTLHKMYEDARKKYRPKRALENPIHDIDPLPEPKDPPKILGSKEDIRAYVAQARKEEKLPGWWIYVAIKLNTGLRQQNIVPLRWKDWEGDVLRIREKMVRRKSFKGFRAGSKSDQAARLVPVNPALRAALEDWRGRSRFASDDDFIVSGRWGSSVAPKTIWDVHKRTLERAGITEYLSEHKLRHTYAVHYLEAGGSIYDLKENLFHSSVTTTELYLKALKSRVARRGQAFQVDAMEQGDKDGGDSK